MTRFLYVEDDAMSRQVVKILLTRAMGYAEDDVTIFEDSAGFLERLRALPAQPDVIFLDIHMQPLDGYEVLELLRMEPGYEETAIIAMTAGVMSTDIENLREAGFNGMIGKPVRKKVFPELLERILAGEAVWFTP
mgnify:CR=1 FL=1